MNRNFALEFVRVTEAAAVASGRWVGRGDKMAADGAATDAMRSMINSIDFDGEVVIGEGEIDEAPMLYIGEKVGTGNGPALDIAVDPLEGTKLLHAPDMYMDKIAVGPDAKGVIDIAKTPTENLKAIAKAKGRSLNELTAVILDRDRHKELIAEVRAAGSRIVLIGDGDVSGAIAPADPKSGIDVLFGSGGAPEGVIAAAALRCVGGDFQGRLLPENPTEEARLREMGISDFNKIYSIDDLARGNVMFAATGVTSGPLLEGVRFFHGGAHTHSIVMRSETGTVRRIETDHYFAKA
jgi:fructose-1,6-bisphosphatase/sedoheptulose 1,7-bisphosphatase-like protein